MKKEKRIFGKVLMVLSLLFFYVPILYMIVFSFNSGRSLTNFEGFSLRWYEHMLQNRDMMESLYTTITIALLATVVSTILGTISAIGLSKSRKFLQKIILQLNDFPIMNPEIVTAIGFMLLFITFHVEKGYVTMHSILKENKFDLICTCGPKPMMIAVAKYAAANGIECEASLENTMACGVGACLCCVENTKEGHVCVCKEGPVFNIKKLLWQI